MKLNSSRHFNSQKSLLVAIFHNQGIPRFCANVYYNISVCTPTVNGGGMSTNMRGLHGLCWQVGAIILRCLALLVMIPLSVCSHTQTSNNHVSILRVGLWWQKRDWPWQSRRMGMLYRTWCGHGQSCTVTRPLNPLRQSNIGRSFRQ